MNPPLRDAAHQAVLWEGLRLGTVDVIGSDHAPHTLSEKRSTPPPFGVPGLETTLPLLCTALREGRLTEERLIDLVALNPQRIFGLPAPPDTYTVVDLDAQYEITRENLRSACGWSPFEGLQVYGKVTEVWIRGHKVFDGEHIFALQQSLKGKSCSVLSLESNHGMSTAVFKSLRKLAEKDPEKKLVVYLRDRQPDREFISLLSSLSDVDFIVVECTSLKNLCDLIQPNEIHAIEASKLIDLEKSPAQLTSV